MIILRDYQNKGVRDIKTSYLSGAKSTLFVLPTGGGKTVLFTYIAQAAARKGSKVLILVHRIELLRQTSLTLKKFGVRHGIINPKYRANYAEAVQVASVQTIVNRLHKIPIGFDLCIVDEAHHATASTWAKVIEHYNARTLGVTATPCRSDGKGLGRKAGGLFDDLVLGPSMGSLIDAGYLVKPRCFAPPPKVDLSGVKSTGGDYNKKQLAEATDRPTITGDAVEHYRSLAHGRPAVAFCVSIKHAEHVASAFRAHGYRAFAVSGKTDADERDRILAGLGNGSVDIVASCDLISEGTDIPAIGAAILLRPTQSTGLYLQQVGRALRTADGKSDAIILDHVGNIIRHGMPDADRDWTLDGEIKKKGKKREVEAALNIQQCPICYTAHEKAPTCPSCGHVYEIKKGGIQQEEGMLQELTPEAIEEQKILARRERKREEAQAQTLEDLQALARKRGYKPGWATHRFKARQGRK